MNLLNFGTNKKDDGSLLEHLDELRQRIIRALLFSFGIMVIIGSQVDFIINEILLRPLLIINPDTKLQNLVPYGQLTLYFQAVLFTGLIISFPIFAYQLWKFVEPGLTPSEKGGTRFIVLFLSVCFFTGIIFGYFVMLPFSLEFFQSFGSPYIVNTIAVNEYVSFFLGTTLTSGIMFELPFAAYILSKIGLLTPAFMRNFRRYAIIGNLIISAIITPSTDAFSMGLIAVPLLVLYEISIFISAYIEKRKNKEMKSITPIP